MVNLPIPVSRDDFLETLTSDLRAENSIRAYEADWRKFVAWCEASGEASLPADPETVVSYLAERLSAGAAKNTVTRAVSGIAYAHREAGVKDPTESLLVRHARANVRKIKRPARRAKPCTVDVLRRGLPTGAGIQDVRDKALLLVGFGAGLRRSEIAALSEGDIEVHEEGLLVRIHASKTNRDADVVGIHRGVHTDTDPVCAYEAWMQARAGYAVQVDGLGSPVFVNYTGARISDRTVYSVVRARLGEAYSPHGALRSGMITAAAKQGADATKISFTSRHASYPVLKGYIRPATLFDNTVHLGL